MTDDPRRHHYVFAHQELRSAALRFGADLVAAGREGTLTLRNVWDRVGESLAEDDRLPAHGLNHTYHELADHLVLLVHLPPAHNPAEAHFTAIALSTEDGGVRYLTLEYAVSPVDESRYTVLGEWDDRRHINYGEGPVADAAAFLGAVDRLLAKKG